MALTFSAQLSGDWGRATKMLAAMSQRMRDAQVKALRKEAEFVRDKIVEGIREQAPGGKRFRPLAPTTLAMRQFLGIKGDAALIERSDLIRAIGVFNEGQDSVSVGVPDHAVNSEGRSLVKIAYVQEHGADYLLRLTDRMRRYLAMAFRKAGLGGGGSGTGSKEHLHIVIPPRPFMEPVFEKYVRNEEFAKRVGRRLMAAFTGIGG